MVLCISDWKMATSFITLILTLFHYSLPPPSCKLLHSSVTVTLFSPSPGFSQRGSRGWQEGQLRTQWHLVCCPAQPKPRLLPDNLLRELAEPQRWQHPSCHCFCFAVTCKGTARLRRPFPSRFFHPSSCSLMAAALQCRCYPSFPNPCDQLFPLHLPLRAVCQDVLKLGNKQQWFTGSNLPCFLLQCGKMVLKSFFKNPILIFCFPFQVCQVKFISVPVSTVTRVKLAFLLALLEFHFSTSLSKINHVPHVFKFHYHDLT